MTLICILKYIYLKKPRTRPSNTNLFTCTQRPISCQNLQYQRPAARVGPGLRTEEAPRTQDIQCQYRDSHMQTGMRWPF